jgi:hypothetical protein
MYACGQRGLLDLSFTSLLISLPIVNRVGAARKPSLWRVNSRNQTPANEVTILPSCSRTGFLAAFNRKGKWYCQQEGEKR